MYVYGIQIQIKRTVFKFKLSEQAGLGFSPTMCCILLVILCPGVRGTRLPVDIMPNLALIQYYSVAGVHIQLISVF